MMYPPIFAVCSSNPGVQAALGSSPCRVFMFGHAPQGTTKPYAVWQLIGGSPENYLATRPDADNWSLQIDVYATTGEASPQRSAIHTRCNRAGFLRHRLARREQGYRDQKLPRLV